MDESGFGVEDLPAVYRDEFVHAVEWARREHDPCDDWARFREALWAALVPALGLDVEVADFDAPSGGGSPFELG